MVVGKRFTGGRGNKTAIFSFLSSAPRSAKQSDGQGISRLGMLEFSHDYNSFFQRPRMMDSYLDCCSVNSCNANRPISEHALESFRFMTNSFQLSLEPPIRHDQAICQQSFTLYFCGQCLNTNSKGVRASWSVCRSAIPLNGPLPSMLDEHKLHSFLPSLKSCSRALY